MKRENEFIIVLLPDFNFVHIVVHSTTKSIDIILPNRGQKCRVVVVCRVADVVCYTTSKRMIHFVVT